MGNDMHSCRIKPDEEGLSISLCLVNEGKRLVADNLVDCFHVVFDAFDRVRRERPLILDLLLANLAPTRIVVRVRSQGVQARPYP